MSSNAKGEGNKHFLSIEKLIASGEKPPKLSSMEIHGLDIHCVEGISSVKEALTTYSSERGIGYQALTRYLCLATSPRIAASSETILVSDLWSEYWTLAKEQKQSVRRANNAALEGLAKSYYPLAKSDYHIWCWSGDNKQALYGTVRVMNMKQRIINPFTASVLSELPDLGELTNDLIEEYQQGLQFLNLIATNLKFFIDRFTHKKGIW